MASKFSSILAMLESGACDRLATLQKKTTTKDAVGGDTPSWGTQSTMWIWLRPASGAKGVFGEQLRPTVTHKIFTPWFDQGTTAIDASMRIQLDSINYNVQYVLDIDNRHEYYEIGVIQGVANT